MDKACKAAVPPVGAVKLRGGMMGRIQQMVLEKMLPFQWEALNDRIDGAEKSYAVRNFRAAAGELDMPHGGRVFQDSDLAKWLEAAAYALSVRPDAKLEAECDEMIDLIARAQLEDGYLNTYYQLTGLDKRFTNLRDNHELYCTGHMLEAAVAYWQATGKGKLLDVMRRAVACIAEHIGPEEGKLHGYPGHEELELALMRLYTLTGEESALRLATYFIDERGKTPHFFAGESQRRGEKPKSPQEEAYFQSHAPVREQETIDGHSVRALYLLSGMLDVACETGDVALLNAARRLFDNATQKRMYITGGVGSTHIGEAFTFDYDLPPDTAYAETCASIALIFAAERLLRMEPSGRYADVIERALYNTCMAGMQLDGSRFFYVNPLEMVPEASHKDARKHHALPERPPWFGCACCPPNLSRLLLSLGAYQYGIWGRDVYMNLYFQGDAALEVDGAAVGLSVETEYPNDGVVRVRAGQGEYRLLLHIPAWCEGFTLTRAGRPVAEPQVLDGYAVLEGPFAQDEEIILTLAMTPRRNWASLPVREVAGCVAITRGPQVYCLEGVDNGEALHTLLLPKGAELQARYEPELLGGVNVITAQGLRESGTFDGLYGTTAPARQDATLTFVPYAAWTNRGENEMRVWVRSAE